MYAVIFYLTRFVLYTNAYIHQTSALKKFTTTYIHLFKIFGVKNGFLGVNIA